MRVSLKDEIPRRVDAAETEIDNSEFVEYDSIAIYELARSIHERGLRKLALERENR